MYLEKKKLNGFIINKVVDTIVQTNVLIKGHMLFVLMIAFCQIQV